MDSGQGAAERIRSEERRNGFRARSERNGRDLWKKIG